MDKNGGEKTEIRLPRWLQHLLFGGAMTSIGAVVYTLAEKEPRLLIETLQKFGPSTFLGLVALVILDRGLKNGITILREGTIAQQRLADAVQAIAQKDDERARELELVVGHLARNSRQILEEIKSMKQGLTEKVENKHAHSASA